MPPKFGGTEKCGRCDKSVYFAERVIAEGKAYHKQCFVCCRCRKGLESTTVTGHGEEIFCKACYGKEFGPAGFRGGTAGGMQHTQTSTNAPASGGASACCAGETGAFCSTCGNKLN